MKPSWPLALLAVASCQPTPAAAPARAPADAAPAASAPAASAPALSLATGFVPMPPAPAPPPPQETPPSVFTVTDRVVGQGRPAQAGDTIVVHYTGTLTDGTVFDSSLPRGPFEAKLGRGMLIQGWERGILGMRVGGKRSLVIPPGMAYGERDTGRIPPGSTLLFEIELLGLR